MHKYAIIFISLFLINNIVRADVKIVDVINKTNSDPTSGKIIVEAEGGCYLYTIRLIGMSTGVDETRTGINGQVTFEYLDADFYTIIVTNSIGCINEFKVEVKNCNDLELNLTLYHICNGRNSGIAFAVVTGGLPPYSYSWYKLGTTNLLISTQNQAINLDKGDYSLVVTDLSQCKSIKLFKIEQPGIEIVNSSRTTLCVTKDKALIEVSPAFRKYKYSWDDGVEITSDRNINERADLLRNRNYGVVATDLQTGCFDGEYLNAFSDIKVDPFIIKTIKHPTTSSSSDGSIIIFMHDPPYVDWPFYVEIIRDGISIERRGLFQKNGLREIKIDKLIAGNYELIVQDIPLCEVDKLNAILYSCNGPIQNPKIQINSYSLPPKSTNSFVKAKVTDYSGDITKCYFRWYNNEYYTYTNRIPELNSQELNKYFANAGSPDNPNFCVKMFCPCTNSDPMSCVSIDPCGNNFTIPFKKRTITNLCSGNLPTGKFINHRPENGKIYLEIDMKNVKKGSLGLQEYNSRISKLLWSDGYPATGNYNQSNEILYITRTISEEKTYYLFLTDGNGCEKFDKIEVKNDFDIVLRYDPNCFYISGCRTGDEEDEKHHEQSIVITNLDECQAELRCGNTKVKDLIGDEYLYYDPYELIEEDGHCYIKRICTFYDEQIDWQNPSYIKYPFRPGHPEFGEVIVVVTKIPVPCCDFDEFGSYAEIRSRLYHVNKLSPDILHLDINSGTPCQAQLLCKNQIYHKLISGAKIDESLCKWSEHFCIKCVTCSFNVGNYIFTSSSFEDNLSACQVVECEGEIPPCQNPQPITISRENLPKIYPNPFDKNLWIYLNRYFSSNIISVEIVNSLGLLIEKNTFILRVDESLINYLPKVDESGLYYIKLSDRSKSINFPIVKL